MSSNKRRKCKMQNSKEKKAIATRLMIISLKVDDYIYKNKQISVHDAQMYMDEIKTYKLKCTNDVRSLQVIEKLIFCMKNIIKESTSTHDTIAENAMVDNGSDRNDNLCPSDNTTSNSNNINKEISKSAYMEDLLKQNMPRTDVQSKKDVNTSLELPNRSAADNDLNFDKSLNFLKETNDGKTNFNEENIYDSQDTNYIDLQIVNLNIDTSCNNKYINNKELLVNSDNNNEKILIPNNNINSYNKKKTNDRKARQLNKQNVTKNNKRQTKKTTRAQKQVKSNAVKKAKTKSDLKGDNSTVVDAKTTDIHNTHIPKKCEIKNDDCPKKQNINADKEITDLSWVENIKYVREVCKDEHTTLNLEDTFWNDLTLPIDWNFND